MLKQEDFKLQSKQSFGKLHHVEPCGKKEKRKIGRKCPQAPHKL
jgi:hypothetical protein